MSDCFSKEVIIKESICVCLTQSTAVLVERMLIKGSFWLMYHEDDAENMSVLVDCSLYSS